MQKNVLHTTVRTLKVLALPVIIFLCSGCFRLPQASISEGPQPRPDALLEYYSYSESYSSFNEILIKDRNDHQLWQIRIETPAGPITVDYYKRKTPNDHVIFVFPVLGGRPVLSTYFADRFVRNGFDAAVVHRNNEFKLPEFFPQIEEILKQGVIRDRIAMDFFEREKQKKTFGAYGISRGAINVAITAGVDKRLKYNVMAMGGTDLPEIFLKARERRIKRYVQKVSELFQLSREEIFSSLHQNLKTNPRHLAHYMEADNALIFLASCDTTVPVSAGENLRVQIDFPETIYVLATHRVGILYTQFLKWVLPFQEACIFPYPYIETEAESFFRRAFFQKRFDPGIILLRTIQFPVNAIASAYDFLYRFATDPKSKQQNYHNDIWQSPAD